MRKIWFTACMLFALSFGITSCTLSQESQAKINVLLEHQAVQSKKLVEAYAKYKTGELTLGELGVLKDDLESNIKDTRDEVLKLKESGIGWGELVGAVLMGLVSRGVPSKGPLASLFGMFSARRQE